MYFFLPTTIVLGLFYVHGFKLQPLLRLPAWFPKLILLPSLLGCKEYHNEEMAVVLCVYKLLLRVARDSYVLFVPFLACMLCNMYAV